MTDLKSRADELIHQFSCVVSDAAVDQLRGSDYAEKVQPPEAALTRFVHALCDIHEQAVKIDRAKSLDEAIMYALDLRAALAALEKGEKA